ncbi:hypothetical protein TNCV_4561101 [Trichonephila clavipes]|nr:hypothetical protein TNCV_4561101 [Trichonephila clavipes]
MAAASAKRQMSSSGEVGFVKGVVGVVSFNEGVIPLSPLDVLEIPLDVSLKVVEFLPYRWVASLLPKFPKSVFIHYLFSSLVRDEGEVLLYGFKFAGLIYCSVNVVVEAIDCFFDVFYAIDGRVAGYCCGENVVKFVPVDDGFTTEEVADMEVKIDDKVDRVVVAC